MSPWARPRRRVGQAVARVAGGCLAGGCLWWAALGCGPAEPAEDLQRSALPAITAPSAPALGSGARPPTPPPTPRPAPAEALAPATDGSQSEGSEATAEPDPEPDQGWARLGQAGRLRVAEAELRATFEAARFAEFLHHGTELLAALEAPDLAADPEARPKALSIKVRMGLALDKVGRPREASALLESLWLAPTTPPGLKVLAARYLGAALIHLDDHLGAELALVEARIGADALGWHAHSLAAEQLQVASLLRRGRLEAAHLGYRRLRDRALVAGNDSVLAAAIEGQALVVIEAGDYHQAAALMAHACALQAARGGLGKALACRTNATVLDLVAGDFQRAEAESRAQAEQARASGLRQIELQAEANRAWALARLDPQAAMAALATTLDALRPEDAPRSVADLRLARLLAADAAGAHGVVEAERAALEPTLQHDASKSATVAVLAAHAARARGQSAAAEQHYQRAADRLEEVRDAFTPDRLTQFVDAQRGEIYGALVAAAAARGDAHAAVRAIGRWKARAFTAQLRTHHDPQHDAHAEAYGAQAPPGGAGHAPGAQTAEGFASGPMLDAHAERTDARLGMARVRQRLEREAPRPPDLAEVTAALPADLAVLEFAVLPEAVVVVLITAQGAEIHSVPIERARLVASIDTLTRALRTGAPWRDEAAWLARHLLDPVRPRLDALRAAGLGRLAVVPHESLHAVPFEVLPWGDGLVVDRLPVFGTPSLGALVTALRTRPAASGVDPAEAPLAVGDAHQDLPGARAEVALLSEVYPDARVLVGAQARLATVTAALPYARLTHFAVHGVRPDAAAPAVLELADGHLHAHQIADLGLRADLVVLSVCDSARGTPNRSDEAVDVLDRAFLVGGARAVVASRWPVHDAASVLFMGHLHRARRDGQSALAAFHGAQQALRRAGKAPGAGPTRGLRPWSGHRRPADYDHPYYWAAFALRGDPR